MGRSGRKRARKATKFLTGNKGFLSTSALIGMAGVAWGIYDTLKQQGTAPGVPEVPGVPGVGSQGAGGSQAVQGSWGSQGSQVPPAPAVPPMPAAFEAALDPVTRVIRLAVSAAKADGALTDQERALIIERAREAGLESVVETELAQTRPLADIVRGVTDAQLKKDLYVLAFTIVRADEALSGAERIYLAQLAHQLGLDAASVTLLEAETSTKIDQQPEA
ncbi:MAG TPA: DUF533 domain-containing protein [Vicinamibacterales bacterium]